MANTGTAIFPGATTLPGSSTIPGQGLSPYIRCLYSTDSPSSGSPTWTYVETSLRSYSTDRGRSSDLEEFDTGTCSLTLDNRTRTFDPLNNSLIRPFNRWWLYIEYSGSVRDVFKGYAQSYVNDWPAARDAIAVVECADEFSVLSAAAMPVTNPPAETYPDLISLDSAVGFWDFNEDPASRQRSQSTDVTDPIVVEEKLRTASVKHRRNDLREKLRRRARRR